MNEIRRYNLGRLIGAHYKNDRKLFCKQAEISESRLTQLLSKNYRDGKGFGEKVARALEEKLGIPPLWLDGNESKMFFTINQLIENHGPSTYRVDLEKDRSAPRVKIVSSGYSENTRKIFDSVEMPEPALTALFGDADAKNYLQLGYAIDDTMSPTFNSGDLLFVKVKLNERGFPEEDGIYVFEYEKTYYVKRLQRVGSRIAVKSDNPLYETWYIEQDHKEHYIFGRVLKSLPMSFRSHT